MEKYTVELHGFGSRGEGDGTITLTTRLCKKNYLCRKLIYTQKQGLKFRIPLLARMTVCFECWVLLGGDLCDGANNGPEES
jgi:hypothetical protein